MIGLFGIVNRLQLQLMRDALNPNYQICLMHSGNSSCRVLFRKGRCMLRTEHAKGAPKGKRLFSALAWLIKR